MGSCISGEHTANSLESTPIARNQEILQDFNVIWFDRKVNNDENQRYQKQLTLCFFKASFAHDISEVDNLIAGSSKPVVFISSGINFGDVKNMVVNKSLVAGILIFCPWPEQYMHLMGESNKVIGVINTFDHLEERLINSHNRYMRFLRFFEGNKESTFIENFPDKTPASYSIFYPVGLKNVEQLTINTVDKIEEYSKKDDSIKKYMESKCIGYKFQEKIEEATNYLKCSKRQPNDILYSYTMENIYYMINFVLREGNSEGWMVFENYLLNLNKALYGVGVPIIGTNSKMSVYRSYLLNDEELSNLAKNKGNYFLLNGFTSTNLDLGNSEFINENR